MARRRKEVETGLVARKVVDAEWAEADLGKDDALANAFASAAKQNIELVEHTTELVKTMMLERKVMADIVSESLKQQVEMTKLQQELLDKKADRRIKLERERAQSEFLQEIANDARALLPVLINKLGKAPMLSAEEAASVRPFIESMTEDQLAKHMSIMTKPQQVAFVAILQAIPDKKEAKPNGGSNGTH